MQRKQNFSKYRSETFQPPTFRVRPLPSNFGPSLTSFPYLHIADDIVVRRSFLFELAPRQVRFCTRVTFSNSVSRRSDLLHAPCLLHRLCADYNFTFNPIGPLCLHVFESLRAASYSTVKLFPLLDFALLLRKACTKGTTPDFLLNNS